MRGRRKTPEGKTRLEDLYFEGAALGLHLREQRLGQGLSLRELEELTGVSDSEIHKLETGSQECRLSSFIRICSVLGLPVGLALDEVILSQSWFFVRRLEKDPRFDELCRERWKCRDSWRDRALIHQLGLFCAAAANLIRCSNPVRRAKNFRYATDPLREAFTRFAELIENTPVGLERANLLKTLQRHPLAELKVRGLLEFRFLDGVAEGRIDTLWSPIFDSAFQHYELDYARIAKYHLAPMAAREWDDLRMRLRTATMKRGARSALARRFNVSTAAVAQWLSGATAPSAETALRLAKFVDIAEAQQEQGAGAVTPAPKTRKSKSSKNEKAKSSRGQKL